MDMPKKYVVLKTTSREKFNEIKYHFSKYNIECSSDYLSINYPIALLEEHSDLIKHENGSVTITSNLIVKQIEENNSKLIFICDYTSKANGFLLSEICDYKPKPWGYDAKFIPNGIMMSYYHLKKKGLYISPRDINIRKFTDDFIHTPNKLTFKELKISRSVDLETDYKNILFNFFDFDKQKDFTGFDFWKKIVNAAICGGLFSTNCKIINYWWPAGNTGILITNNLKDSVHEKIFMMNDIFNFLVSDLLYTGNNEYSKNYEWIYAIYRLMNKCFTLVLSNMFYVHYLIINGIEYKTIENVYIYPIFEAIYGKKVDVFTNEIFEEVIRASCLYGIYGYDAGFVALFVKYNGTYKLEEFRMLVKSFRDKYNFYLIQDLKNIVNNTCYMKEHQVKYNYFNRGLEPIIKRLNIIPVESIQLEEVNYLIEIGLKQFHKTIAQTEYHENTILKNKFFRWTIGQLCFFEHYSSIPIVDGYKSKFYELMNDILIEIHISNTFNKIRNFRYQWDYLMDRCSEFQIITIEEANQYKEVFPIYDPYYISSYENRIENQSEVISNFLNYFKF
jgi:hypothetical protein